MSSTSVPASSASVSAAGLLLMVASALIAHGGGVVGGTMPLRLVPWQMLQTAGNATELQQPPRGLLVIVGGAMENSIPNNNNNNNQNNNEKNNQNSNNNKNNQNNNNSNVNNNQSNTNTTTTTGNPLRSPLGRWMIKIYGDGIEYKFPLFIERIVQQVQSYFSVYKGGTERPQFGIFFARPPSPYNYQQYGTTTTTTTTTAEKETNTLTDEDYPEFVAIAEPPLNAIGS